MPLLKDQKKHRGKEYAQRVSGAVNTVAFGHSAIPVNFFNQLRMEVQDHQGTIEIVKKRVLLKGLGSNSGLDESMLSGSVAVLYSYNQEDPYAPLKSLNTVVNSWKKDKRPFTVDYLAGFFDTEWKDSSYTSVIAELPSKEELLSKLLYLFKFPLSQCVRTLQAIADSKA